MHRPFSAAARALLDAGTDRRARRFADAVVRQVAFPPGSTAAGPGGGAVATDVEVAAALVHFLHAAGQIAPVATDRPPPSANLLSSIFQNVDLLYADGYENADRVSLLLMSYAWEEQPPATGGQPEPTEES